MSKSDSAHYVKAMRKMSSDLDKAVEQIASAGGHLQSAAYTWRVSKSEADMVAAYQRALFVLNGIVAQLGDVAGIEGQVPEYGRIQHRMTAAQIKKIHGALAEAEDVIYSVNPHIVGMSG